MIPDIPADVDVLTVTLYSSPGSRFEIMTLSSVQGAIMKSDCFDEVNSTVYSAKPFSSTRVCISQLTLMAVELILKTITFLGGAGTIEW